MKNTKTMNPRLVSLLQPNSQDSQRYQRLRLAVENLPRLQAGVVVAVTSPSDGEGKTLTAINLAGALAQNPMRKVLLMELDLRASRKSIKDYLGVKKWSPPGVVDSIVGNNEKWQQLTDYIPAFNLHLLTAGQHTQSPYEVLNAPQMGEMINDARRNFDYVVLDTASVTLYPDTQLISKWVDKFIVLVSSGKTSKHTLEECFNLMSPDKVMGIVFNECNDSGYERNGH
ncbi:MAG: CpsD/CapB family tyrosine-protein kinase [Pseudohongiella sp.]|uniref:tyrosine-protein kinase family protein n=1 Tax=Pseudohongiella sp. TaxID=1979412 RepID=UPI0034A03C95